MRYNKIIRTKIKRSHMYKEFYDLDIWKQGYNLLMNIYDITEKFPDFEKYSLTS
ncbi:MAG TPA: hypothetical protein DEB09_01965 [Candidatus Magasanikbacteria bacterium]|nr:hypothetical protein [Candidatus Magasanikbacteria bacterium]